MNNLAIWVGVVVLILGLIGGLTLLSGLIIWVLWNWVLVSLGAPHISYWLAVGVSLVLSVIGNTFKSHPTT